MIFTNFSKYVACIGSFSHVQPRPHASSTPGLPEAGAVQSDQTQDTGQEVFKAHPPGASSRQRDNNGDGRGGGER
eukprot:1539590-Prymnesium_polylepis.1